MSREKYLSDIFKGLDHKKGREERRAIIHCQRNNFVEELINFKLDELGWQRDDCDIKIVNDGYDNDFSISIIKDKKRVNVKINFGLF